MPKVLRTFQSGLVCIAVLAALLFCFLPGSAQKAYADNMVETVDGVKFAYIAAEDGAYLGAVSPKNSANVVIPSHLGGYPVVCIYACAFDGWDALESVSIPDTVIYIGDLAFRGCTALKSVTLPDSVQVIGQSAFKGCVQFQSITLPKSVKSVHPMAFDECTSLREILVDPQNPHYSSFNGLLCSKGLGGVYICPPGFTGKSLTFDSALGRIDYFVFRGCRTLESIVINKADALDIRSEAFAECTSLKSVVIKGSVGFIESDAFLNCASLETLEIHGTAMDIRQSAFKGCTSLRNVYYGGSSLQWKDVVSDVENDSLLSADIRFGSPDRVALLVRGYAARCEVPGVKDCYFYEGEYFTDVNANNKIANIETWKVIPPLGHNFKSVVKKATFKTDGRVATECSRCGYTGSQTMIPRIWKVELSKATYSYDGKAKSPSVVVKNLYGDRISSKYYTVSAPKGRTNVGSYVYKVTFKGRYSGSKSLTLKVNPKGTSISSLKAKGKSFTVKWKKQSIKMKTKRITGYEVRYSLKFNMASAKTVKVKGYTKCSAKIAKLKKSRTYFVQIRTYMTTGGKTYYSAWSANKDVCIV